MKLSQNKASGRRSHRKRSDHADGCAKGHPLVHIASHFLLSDEGDSFLLLGDGSRLTLERIALISSLTLRQQQLPRLFAYLGFATTAVLLAGLVGYGLLLRSFIVIAVGVGGFLLVRAWFVWAGLLLQRSAAS
jgi:hypothetical protein